MKSGRKLDIDLETMAYCVLTEIVGQQYFSAQPYRGGKMRKLCFQSRLFHVTFSTRPRQNTNVRPFAQPSSSTVLTCNYRRATRLYTRKCFPGGRPGNGLLARAMVYRGLLRRLQQALPIVSALAVNAHKLPSPKPAESPL